MELTKEDNLIAKGIGIIGMVLLHLFCRQGELPYCPMIWVGDTPLIYYIGLLGDMCVPIFCFCSGYAQFMLYEKTNKQYIRSIFEKLLRFMCNFWIIVILFSVIGVIFNKSNIMPCSISEFLGNIFLYNLSYNGAWWFVLTYVLLLLLSPVLIKWIEINSGILILLLSGIVYFVAYVLRFKFSIIFSNNILNWIFRQGILIGTAQIGYIAGMICRKNKWISWLRVQLHEKSTSSRFCYYGMIFILLIGSLGMHCVIHSAFLAIFTAGSMLLVIYLINLPRCVKRILAFWGKHSTNIWLVHMFFYLTLFENFVFVFKYPLLITILMFAICLIVSQVVNLIYYPINACLKNKFKLC